MLNFPFNFCMFFGITVIIPKNPYISPISTMGTLLGVHPIVPWLLFVQKTSQSKIAHGICNPTLRGQWHHNFLRPLKVKDGRDRKTTDTKKTGDGAKPRWWSFFFFFGGGKLVGKEIWNLIPGSSSHDLVWGWKRDLHFNNQKVHLARWVCLGPSRLLLWPPPQIHSNFRVLFHFLLFLFFWGEGVTLNKNRFPWHPIKMWGFLLVELGTPLSLEVTWLNFPSLRAGVAVMKSGQKMSSDLGDLGRADLQLTWPMAKRFKLFGITYLVGKLSRSNFLFQGPGRLSESKTCWFCWLFHDSLCA